MHSIPFVLCGVLIVILLYTDIRSLKIPNKITIPAAALALFLHIILYSWRGLLWSLTGLLVLFSVTFFAYACKAIGAGDVKACAAIGAFVGVQDAIAIFAYAMLAAALIGVIVLIARGTITLWVTKLATNIVCFAVHREWRHLLHPTKLPLHVIPFMPAVALGFIYRMFVNFVDAGGAIWSGFAG